MLTAMPSGKFWMPMPRASAIAPPMVAPSSPAAAPPNSTPTARPSGMLCSVMAMTSSVVRCQSVLGPSASFSSKLMWRWGVNLSNAKRKRAPMMKPIAAGITLAMPSPPAMSMAGINRPKQLAATITPPVNPSMPSSILRWSSLKKKTKEAPAAVISQVKIVAIRAASTGPESRRKRSIPFTSMSG